MCVYIYIYIHICNYSFILHAVPSLSNRNDLLDDPCEDPHEASDRLALEGLTGHRVLCGAHGQKQWLHEPTL